MMVASNNSGNKVNVWGVAHRRNGFVAEPKLVFNGLDHYVEGQHT